MNALTVDRYGVRRSDTSLTALHIRSQITAGQDGEGCIGTYSPFRLQNSYKALPDSEPSEGDISQRASSIMGHASALLLADGHAVLTF